MTQTATLPVGVRRAGSDLRRARRRTALLTLAICAPSLSLVLLIVVLPVGWLFWLSFRDGQGFTLHHYARMLTNPGYLMSLKTTLLMSSVVTLGAAVLAYPVAYLIAAVAESWARLLMIIVLIPLWTALLVRTFAWLVLLQRTGPINGVLMQLDLIDAPLEIANNFTGTAIGMTHIMVPFMVLPLLAAMREIDDRLLIAARSLGASRWRAFWNVYFPLSVPALLAGIVLIFVMSIGFYVIPAFLGGGRILMWSMKIESNVNVYSDWGAASALGVVMLFIAIAALSLLRLLVGSVVRRAA